MNALEPGQDRPYTSRVGSPWPMRIGQDKRSGWTSAPRPACPDRPASTGGHTMSTVATRNRVTPIPWPRFRDQIVSNYSSKDKGTLSNVERGVRFLDGFELKTTSDLSPKLLDRLRRKKPKAFSQLWIIHAFCELAVNWGYLASSPFLSRPELLRAMRGSRSPRVRAIGPNPAQVKQVLEYLESRSKVDTLSYRLYVEAALVAFTGHKIGKLPSIRVADVDFEARVIRFQTAKGTKLSPMVDDLAEVLTRWLRDRRYGGRKGNVFNEAKVAEARRLRAGRMVFQRPVQAIRHRRPFDARSHCGKELEACSVGWDGLVSYRRFRISFAESAPSLRRRSQDQRWSLFSIIGEIEGCWPSHWDR